LEAYKSNIGTAFRNSEVGATGLATGRIGIMVMRTCVQSVQFKFTKLSKLSLRQHHDTRSSLIATITTTRRLPTSSSGCSVS